MKRILFGIVTVILLFVGYEYGYDGAKAFMGTGGGEAAGEASVADAGNSKFAFLSGFFGGDATTRSAPRVSTGSVNHNPFVKSANPVPPQSRSIANLPEPEDAPMPGDAPALTDG